MIPTTTLRHQAPTGGCSFLWMISSVWHHHSIRSPTPPSKLTCLLKWWKGMMPNHSFSLLFGALRGGLLFFSRQHYEVGGLHKLSWIRAKSIPHAFISSFLPQINSGEQNRLNPAKSSYLTEHLTSPSFSLTNEEFLPRQWLRKASSQDCQGAQELSHLSLPLQYYAWYRWGMNEWLGQDIDLMMLQTQLWPRSYSPAALSTWMYAVLPMYPASCCHPHPTFQYCPPAWDKWYSCILHHVRVGSCPFRASLLPARSWEYKELQLVPCSIPSLQKHT